MKRLAAFMRYWPDGTDVMKRLGCESAAIFSRVTRIRTHLRHSSLATSTVGIDSAKNVFQARGSTSM